MTNKDKYHPIIERMFNDRFTPHLLEKIAHVLNIVLSIVMIIGLIWFGLMIANKWNAPPRDIPRVKLLERL